jgi:acetate kinase
LRVLVVNAGSSSLKLRLIDANDTVLASADTAPGGDVAAAIEGWPVPDVVAHRIVHGGTSYRSAVRVDAAVEKHLAELTDLAPLHQPKSLAGLAAVRKILPAVPTVACFDTAFHASIPDAAATYAVPAEWRSRYGIRRYGFHGLSHAYISSQVPVRRLVSCHLGAGASLCAVLDGRSVDTTMGFTPLEGLVMATRSGSVDPGLVLWLEEHEGLSPHEVAETLEHRSGMLALTGTADMREVESRYSVGDSAAVAGVDVYIHRLVTSIGSMTASLEGLDALAFTGGVGEHSSLVRHLTTERLAWLGVGTGVPVHVIEAREDLQIAKETRALLDLD